MSIRRAASKPAILARLVIALVMTGGPAIGIAIAAQAVLGRNPVSLLVATLGVAALVVFLYWLYVRWLEHRPLHEFAPSGALRELGFGMLLGAGLFCATIGVLAAVGAFRLVGTGRVAGAGVAFLSALTAGVAEEVLFRGVLFRIVEELAGSWLAIAVSAIVFGLVHFASPHPTLLGIISIALEAGVLLAAAYMATRRLWLPIGIHFAWNFTQGGIFGVAVSGTPSSGLLRGSLAGPEWLTGGEFGAEASLIAVSFCLALAAALLVRARRAGRIVRSSWSATVPA